jgi:glycosyltransferase involved in cell wall biosynthesis
MNGPKVSVLLPCRNGSGTLALALRSILNQSFEDFEILLLNDGSTDNSVALASGLRDPRIHILGDSIARGLPWRLNEGVVAARGQYIARMDADDVSFPLRLERQVDFLEANREIDLVGTRAVVFRTSGEVLGLLPFAGSHTALCAQPWRNIPLPHPTWMGRRSWFEMHPYRIPEVRRAEDQELLLRGLPDSRYACLDEVLLGYRQGSFQLRRTLIARFALLSAQAGIFFTRGEWKNITGAFGISMIKILLDGFAALPGADNLFFNRMKSDVSDHIKDELSNLLREVGEPAL